jgi:hypothetical protein
MRAFFYYKLYNQTTMKVQKKCGNEGIKVLKTDRRLDI